MNFIRHINGTIYPESNSDGIITTTKLNQEFLIKENGTLYSVVADITCESDSPCNLKIKLNDSASVLTIQKGVLYNSPADFPLNKITVVSAIGTKFSFDAYATNCVQSN